jgi:serine/threonine protein kinase
VLARIGPEELVRQVNLLQKGPQIGAFDGVGYSDLLAAGLKDLVLFSQPITYSEVDIGKAVVALSAESMQQSSARARSIFGSGIVAITLLMVAFLLWFDRGQKKKALERIRRLESEDTIGPYHLISKVAQGGMAELFLADCLREDGFRRRLAVKRILPHFATDEDFIQMFIREARLAALLQHPNIVQVFDYGKIEDVSYIAMEYIDGKSLGQVIAAMNEGLPPEPAVFIISEICKGLEYSHSRVDDQTGKALNIVHRDISPQNILVSYQGEVKISDFGISKARTEPNLTQTGKLKGKLMYLAPEQVTGEAVDHRLDLYALGLVFYQILTGNFAYQFDSEVEAIKNIPTIAIEPLRSRKAGIPEELDRIVMRCLEKSVATRYQSAAAILADLIAFKKSRRMTFDSADLAALMKTKFQPGAHA